MNNYEKFLIFYVRAIIEIGLYVVYRQVLSLIIFKRSFVRIFIIRLVKNHSHGFFPKEKPTNIVGKIFANPTALP